MKKLLLRLRNRFYPGNSCSISRQARYSCEGNLLKCRILVIGSGELIIHAGVRLRNIAIHMRGEGNRLILHAGSIVSGLIELFGDNNVVEIGAKSKINGAFIGAHNGTSISIGTGCLFSTGIDIRTTDSHKIFNADGERINPDKNIIIRDRVWLGRGVSVQKGTDIGTDCVVGSLSLVSGRVPNNTISAGVPAKVLKTGVTWEE